MTAQKRPGTDSVTGSGPPRSRKTWKKKTQFDVVLDQEEKLKTQIGERESELANLRQQLEKLEKAREIFES